MDAEPMDLEDWLYLFYVLACICFVIIFLKSILSPALTSLASWSCTPKEATSCRLHPTPAPPSVGSGTLLAAGMGERLEANTHSFRTARLASRS